MSLLPPVQQAVETLGRAKGHSALIAAHQTLQRAVYTSRKRVAATYGNLAKSYMAAMQIWDAQKADGVPILERVAGLEKTLRAAWPTVREWHFLCPNCSDHGLVPSTCPGDATCGRHRPHMPHSFGTPCWCERGRAFHEKPKPDADDFTNAGKSKPMTRLGR